MGQPDPRLARLTDVLEAVARLRAAAEFDDFSGGKVTDGDRRGMTARVLSAIQACTPPESQFRQQAEEVRAGSRTEGRTLERLVGILKALKLDVEKGYEPLGDPDVSGSADPVQAPQSVPCAIPDKFQELLEPVGDAYRNIELQFVTAKQGGELHLLGGEVRLTDVPPDRWKKSEHCFENDEVAVLHDLTVVPDLRKILDGLAVGVIPVGKRQVVLRSHTRGTDSLAPLAVSAFDPVQRHAAGELIDERFGLTCILNIPEEEFGVQWCERMERKLSNKGYDSLQELLSLFIAGHEGGRGRARRFELAVPLPIQVELRPSEGSLIVAARANKMLNRDDLECSLKFILGDHSSNKVSATDTFRMNSGWKETGVSYDFEVSRPLVKCDRVHASVRYHGERITRTSVYITPIPAPLLYRGVLSKTIEPPPEDWSDFKDGKERALSFLDVDVEGHSELLKSDPGRTGAALDELRRVFEEAARSVGGRPVWSADGGVAFFVGRGRAQRAARAGVRTFLAWESALLDAPEKLRPLVLRAGVDSGITDWFDDTTRIRCNELNWAAHAQKKAGPGPRMTVSKAIFDEVGDAMKLLFRPAETFEEKPSFEWWLPAAKEAALTRLRPGLTLDVIVECLKSEREEVRAFLLSRLDPSVPVHREILMRAVEHETVVPRLAAIDRFSGQPRDSKLEEVLQGVERGHDDARVKQACSRVRASLR